MNPWLKKTWRSHYADTTALTDAAGDAPAERLLSRLLELRGVPESERRDFLEPETLALHDPFLFRDMALACEVIREVIRAGGKILVYGDYDCDGLTSTSLLIRFFRENGVNCDYIIPDRLLDGYGLSDETTERVIAAKPDLVITVDCGIVSTDHINRMMLAGIPVIVTDHHMPGEELPPALAVINPQVESDSYPFAHLAGVGVALKLLTALTKVMGLDDFDFAPYFVLTAIGTVADSMPLTDENRIIVSRGLAAFNEHAPIGIRAMLSSLRSDRADSRLIGFSIAPRLNAAGRMGDIEPAMTLLLSESEEEAEAAIKSLDAMNDERRNQEQAVFNAAVEQIRAKDDFMSLPFLVVKGDDWHPGVSGIVSARLAERFQVPIITFAKMDGEYRGSARSYGDFDILAAIQAVEMYTEGYGGHRMAAGVTVLPEMMDRFETEITRYASVRPEKPSGIPEVYYDLEIAHDYLSEASARELTRLEPFGQGNERPVFLIRGLTISDWREVGNGTHVTISAQLENGAMIRGIGFRMSEYGKLFRNGDKADILAYLNLNEWNNQVRPQLQIVDWHLPETGWMLWDHPVAMIEAFLEKRDLAEIASQFEIPLRQLRFSKDDLSVFYQRLREAVPEDGRVIHPSYITRAVVRDTRRFLTPFALVLMLELWSAAGSVKLEHRGPDQFMVRFISAPDLPAWQATECYDRYVELGVLIE